MNARTDTTPAPIRDGRAHDLTAWEEYWDTHGYTPVGLDESQASGKAVELSHKASRSSSVNSLECRARTRPSRCAAGARRCA